MSIVSLSLKKPYTVISLVILVCLLGAFFTRRMPVDIFPEIDIPVISIVWSYGGMSAEEVQTRIIDKHERQLASLVDDMDRVESNSYAGVGVIKVYLHDGANIARAVSQLSSSAQVVLKSLPRNITPPLVVRYSATDVPVVQLSLASEVLSDTKLNDYGQNLIRPALATVKGAQVPYPYGGKPRIIEVDLDVGALHAKNLTPRDVADALRKQNVIAPSGTVKVGNREYPIELNNSTQTIDGMNAFPVKRVDGATVFLRDVAFVHNGHQVQSNAVAVNGRPGALMVIRKTGGVSTLKVIDSVLRALPDIDVLLPRGMTVKPVFNQALFVEAALRSVLMGGAMAAGLTGLMILLFLGNWRLTLIIVASIPLSVVAALLVMYGMGETLNTMTLGGFALAVGILVDNATVVIENIERNLSLGNPLEHAIVEGAREIGLPTVVSTFSICIVFVPIFLLQGVAKYLFSPLAISVITSLIASLVISFTLVPVLFKYLIGPYLKKHGHRAGAHDILRRRNPFMLVHLAFISAFNLLRAGYRNYLSWSVDHPWLVTPLFVALMLSGAVVYPLLGQDFFPSVDAGQLRLHVRAPAGTRLEKTQMIFSRVEHQLRQIIGPDIDIMLDNIGLPYSGINTALSDSSTVGPMDGDILISLKKDHRPTADYVARIRRELPREFPQLVFFFQPADIVNQVLNFGLPSPIDVRVVGPHGPMDYDHALKLAGALRKIPGVVDTHIFQVPDAPALHIDVDRTLADARGLSQDDVSKSLLVAVNNSESVDPNFWINPRNNVSYRLDVLAPDYRINSLRKLNQIPLSSPAAGGVDEQVLMGLAKVHRTHVPLVLSELDLKPVYDVNADVQGRDLASVGRDIGRVVAENPPPPDSGIKVIVAGQVQTMQSSFAGLYSGMLAAVVLVYLLMAINFQSWVDPVVVLMAVPLALAGVVWALFITHTHISVPALMGSLMCIGLTTANSILVVAFARQRLAAGDTPLVAAVAAGYTRLRPVLMTAGAMILGMIPMAMGVGEGGEQNAPLARAVIGGLIFATFATLVFVPAAFRLFYARHQPQPDSEA